MNSAGAYVGHYILEMYNYISSFRRRKLLVSSVIFYRNYIHQAISAALMGENKCYCF